MTAPRRLLQTLAVTAAVALAAVAGTGAAAAPADDRNAPASETTPAAGGQRSGGSDPSLVPDPPSVESTAWLAYSVDDEAIVGGRGIRAKRAIASLTKLMTALVVVEHTKGDEKVTVSAEAVKVGGASGELKVNATYTVDELLTAMLAASANDAAMALAEHVGGEEQKFIELMNRRAVRLDLAKTTFASVTGLDTPGNGSTPLDLLAIAQTAMQDRRIASAVAQQKVRLSNPGGVSKVLDSRNELLGTYPGADGVKTGFTDDAGYCLISRVVDPETGNTFYVVQLGAPSEEARWSDAHALLDWATSLRPEVQLARAGDRVATAPTAYTDENVTLSLGEDISVSMLIGSSITERVIVPAALVPPLAAGDTVGKLEIVARDEVVATSPIVVDQDVGELDLRTRLRYFAERIPEAWNEGVRLITSPLRDSDTNTTPTPPAPPTPAS